MSKTTKRSGNARPSGSRKGEPKELQDQAQGGDVIRLIKNFTPHQVITPEDYETREDDEGFTPVTRNTRSQKRLRKTTTEQNTQEKEAQKEEMKKAAKEN
jgi:hypothetical protein